MRDLDLNIGLNVGNVEPAQQLQKTLNFFLELFGNAKPIFRIENGVYESQEGKIFERTLVIAMDSEFILSSNSFDYFKERLQFLCKKLNQECIAYHLNGLKRGFLVYPNDFDGIRNEFSSEYFIPFDEK